MSDSPSESATLRWEWPADRVPDHRILVRIDAIREERGGLLGIRRSPSLADALPNPVELEATVVAGDAPGLGRRLSLRLPRPELHDIAVGDHAAMGLLGPGTCICIAKAPAGTDQAAQERWLASWNCGGAGG